MTMAWMCKNSQVRTVGFSHWQKIVIDTLLKEDKPQIVIDEEVVFFIDLCVKTYS